MTTRTATARRKAAFLAKGPTAPCAGPTMISRRRSGSGASRSTSRPRCWRPWRPWSRPRPATGPRSAGPGDGLLLALRRPQLFRGQPALRRRRRQPGGCPGSAIRGRANGPSATMRPMPWRAVVAAAWPLMRGTFRLYDAVRPIAPACRPPATAPCRPNLGRLVGGAPGRGLVGLPGRPGRPQLRGDRPLAHDWDGNFASTSRRPRPCARASPSPTTRSGPPCRELIQETLSGTPTYPRPGRPARGGGRCRPHRRGRLELSGVG